MVRTLAQLEAILRAKVCGACPDSDPEGGCGRPNPDTCSLFALLGEVAKVVVVTDSDRLEDYVEAIREHVCNLCGELALDGGCDTRRQVRCSVDAHLGAIADAIDEYTGRKLNRGGLGVLHAG